MCEGDVVKESSGAVVVPFGGIPKDVVAWRGPAYVHDRKTFKLLEIDHSKEGVKVVLKDGSQKWMTLAEYDAYQRDNKEDKA